MRRGLSALVVASLQKRAALPLQDLLEQGAQRWGLSVCIEEDPQFLDSTLHLAWPHTYRSYNHYNHISLDLTGLSRYLGMLVHVFNCE
jgi:hypothetical protein